MYCDHIAIFPVCADQFSATCLTGPCKISLKLQLYCSFQFPLCALTLSEEHVLVQELGLEYTGHLPLTFDLTLSIKPCC